MAIKNNKNNKYTKVVTFYLGQEVLEILSKIERGNKSKYVTNAIKEKHEKQKKNDALDKLMNDLKRQPEIKGNNTVKILRKFRYS